MTTWMIEIARRPATVDGASPEPGGLEMARHCIEFVGGRMIAGQVVSAHPDIVILGSVDVPTVSAFVHVFIQQHFNPKAFVATAGPDQGAAFITAVGTGNEDGIFVPGGWSGNFPKADSKKMVREYIAKYGGTPSTVNADVAEGYAVGQVVAQAVHPDEAPAVGAHIPAGDAVGVRGAQVAHRHWIGSFQSFERLARRARGLPVHRREHRHLGDGPLHPEPRGDRGVEVVVLRGAHETRVARHRGEHPRLDLPEIGPDERVAVLGQHRLAQHGGHVVQPARRGHPPGRAVGPGPRAA